MDFNRKLSYKRCKILLVQCNSPLPLHLDLIWVGQLELELAVTRMVVVITSYCFRTSSTTLDESLRKVYQILQVSNFLVILQDTTRLKGGPQVAWMLQASSDRGGKQQQ